jgi:dienelactone hydrolase
MADTGPNIGQLAPEIGVREWRDSDVTFVEKLIAALTAETGADLRRVALVGFSLGGFLASEVAYAQPSPLAAAVNFSGSRFEPAAPCAPGAVSVLFVHGDLVSDNGPEFVGRVLDAWAHARGVKLQFIRPGKRLQRREAARVAGQLDPERVCGEEDRVRSHVNRWP